MDTKTKNTKIIDLFGVKQTKGDFGIEVELECETPYPKPVAGWKTTNDGSLKTEYAVEYVTIGAVDKKEVPDYVMRLSDALAKKGTKILYSVRAGIHIHMNMQEHTVEETFRTALLYYMFETVLARFCGDSRVGNLFCLRFRDAEYLAYALDRVIEQSDWGQIYSDHIRYSALNFASLPKYGSIEFRGLETSADFLKIVRWCDILDRIRNFAVACNTTEELAAKLSYFGPEDFLHEIVGKKHYKELVYEGMGDDIVKDFRLVQPLIYSLEY